MDIDCSDVTALRDVLRSHDEIKVIELDSTGGGECLAIGLAALVIDFDLNTHIKGICES